MWLHVIALPPPDSALPFAGQSLKVAWKKESQSRFGLTHEVPSAEDLLQHYAGGFAFGAFDNRAEREDLFAGGFEGLLGLVGVFGLDDHDHADTVVEDAVHFMAVDVAFFFKPVEDRGTGPGRAVDAGLNAFGKNAGHVFDEAAPSDVGHTLDRDLLHDFENRLHVDAGGFHDAVGERGAVKGHRPVGAGHFDDLANEGEAVRVGAARSQTEDDVARANRGTVDDLVLFDDADRKAREVVFDFGVHAGHFGGFAADQCATGQLAPLGHTRHDARGNVDVKLSAGVVVEEEKTLCALHQNIVHAHRNEVLTDRVVAAEAEGEHQLRTHTVRTGDEDGVLVLFADFEEGAEAADGTENAGDERALGRRLDAFDELVAGIDGNAGSRVGKLTHG